MPAWSEKREWSAGGARLLPEGARLQKRSIGVCVRRPACVREEMRSTTYSLVWLVSVDRALSKKLKIEYILASEACLQVPPDRDRSSHPRLMEDSATCTYSYTSGVGGAGRAAAHLLCDRPTVRNKCTPAHFSPRLPSNTGADGPDSLAPNEFSTDQGLPATP